MIHICIGVHVHAEPERLRATIEALRANTAHAVELLLLPDGPDQATAAALAELRALPQLGTAEPCGAPACFNRLASASDAQVLILLESGSLVGPGWLDHLLAALDADPRNGLAGPSTNRAWNEQCAFPHSGGTSEEIARTAQAAIERFGSLTRTLEPLHSLADFCYVVRREVIEGIGAADEGYGLGPCWEMDYNIRAARAGFRGVWACAAYVYRGLFTARRRFEDARRFEASKRRYQDAICGLRLRGQRADYEPHCRGEACEHFAPPGLMRMFLPLAHDARASQATGDHATGPPNSKETAGESEAAVDSYAARGMLHPSRPRPPGSQTTHYPLVSCIMPTGDRPDYVLQSIGYFQRQDYSECELIILDDGAESIANLIPADPRIRYLRLPERQSIGAKRNYACSQAHGAIIAHWDDDDWYAPDRLSAQLAPLLAGAADISALRTGVFFDLPRWSFWRCTPDLHRRLFVEDIHGGTLVYQRRVWEQLAHYPDRSLAEDAIFLRQSVRQGARLSRLDNTGQFIYLRHTTNSWSFVCGQHLDPRGWQRVAEPTLPPADRAFYAGRSPAAGPAPAPPAGPSEPPTPLVSCIMPTYNRRRYAAQAIAYFQRQDYPERELIILDDGSDPIADLVPPDPRIHYVSLDTRLVLGAKRNYACELAQGTIIAHWDDDDWIAPHRLHYQVAALERHQADLCGAGRQLYYDPDTDRAWLYQYPPTLRRWIAGNTLCYRKTFWARNHFPNVAVGEDTQFAWSPQATNVAVVPDHSFYVGLIHPDNTSRKVVSGAYWQPHSPEEVHRLLGADLAFYRNVLESRL